MNKPIELDIAEEFETIHAIIDQKASIARFGDGELRVAIGMGCKTQKPNAELEKKFKHILKADIGGLFVGIPRIVGRNDLIAYKEHLLKGKHEFWVKYFTSDRYTHLYNPKKVYYSSFITRPDNAPHIDCKRYWMLCKQIWEGERVLFVQGATGKRGFEKAIARTAFDNATIHGYVEGPAVNAYDEYDRILNQILDKVEPGVMVALALGSTATALVYDLHKRGIRALDLGHWGLFFAREHPKGIKQ
jgi:hypothetical protein